MIYPHWRPRAGRSLPFAALWLALATPALAESATDTTPTLPAVTVEATRDDQTPPQQLDPTTSATRYVVTPDAIATQAPSGGTNPYAMVGNLPGVKAQTVDAYGLVNMQGGNKGLRVRGEVATHGANGLLGGVPLNGPGPGPGYLFLVDRENIAAITLSQGPIAPDEINFYNSFGAMNTALKWPTADRGGAVSYAYGSENFQRLFGRIDSGTLSTGSALFLSGSSTSADKWRGSGDSPDHQDIVSAGFSQVVGDFSARVYLAHTDMAQDNYRGLTYAQIGNLSNYNDYDYTATPTGTTRAEWATWQGYNRQSFESTAVISELAYAFSDDTVLTFKPFYLKEEGYFRFGQPSAGSGTNVGQVRDWIIDHDNYGAVTTLETKVASTQLKFGHAFLSAEPPGPPTQWRQYAPTADGTLTPLSYSMLADVVHRHQMNSLFATAEQQIDALRLKAGVRYLSDRLPAINAYTTTGISSSLSYDDALAQATLNPARSVTARTLTAWLPYLDARYTLSPSVELRAAIGRNAGTPALDVWNSAPPTGMTTQQLWDTIDLEKADAIDLGARLDLGSVHLEPTLYYTRYTNKAVTFYDPALNASYTQNVADAHQAGAQLMADWQLLPTLQMFGNLSWMVSEFDDDVQTAASTLIEADGQQLPDVPKLMANLGATWQWQRLSVTPSWQYMGKRYADIQHDESVGSYAITNLDVAYTVPTSAGDVITSLHVVNLFDRQYIGYISSNELTSPGGTTYYPGAPRTLVAEIKFAF